MLRLSLISALLAVLAAGQSPADACGFQKVEIKPLTVENGDTYVGQAGGVELRLHNDVQGRAVTVFPEPPLEVRRDGATCKVEDGGVWGREAIWLSEDGSTLATTESSGSYEGLVFRDTASCARLGELEVTGKTWRVEGRSLQLLSADNAKAGKPIRLDAACRLPARKKKR